jgi:replication-associated recombination protein RarA
LINPQDFEPKRLDDCVFSHPNSKTLLEDLIAGTMPFPAFGKSGILLYGPPGTGKTTLANLLPDAIEAARSGEDSAYSNFCDCRHKTNGAQYVAKIANWVELVSLNRSGLHYMVLDEADNLTDTAQSQLKGVMNTRNTVFILTSNHVDQIQDAIRNRCHEIPMFAAQPVQWLGVVKSMISAAGLVPPPDQALLPVIANGQGSARAIMTNALEIALRARSQQGA